MGFQSPSAFSAITPTSPNWPPKSLQWVLLGHRGASPCPSPSSTPSHPVGSMRHYFSHSPVPLSLHVTSSKSWLSPHSSGTCTPIAELCWEISTISRMESAASIELKTGPQNVQLSLPVSMKLMESVSVFPNHWNPSLSHSQWLTLFLISQRK